jgi:hypothetical protein
MIYVALLEGVAVIATALSFTHLVRSLIREHARERNLILNQLLHLAGRTWQPPPTPDRPPRTTANDEIDRYVASLSQLPDED